MLTMKKKTKKQDTVQYVLVGVAVLLLVLSGAQAIKIDKLSDQVEEMGSASQPVASQPLVPKAPAPQPTMVGGC